MSLRVITKVRNYDAIANFRNYVTTLILVPTEQVFHAEPDPNISHPGFGKDNCLYHQVAGKR
jgi:hypothetical protein